MVASDIKGCCSAILMPDATVLVGVPHEATVCLEIKPKFGSILRCETIQDSRHRHLKHTRSRYSLHQTLKLQQGLIKEKSEYEPLDLFSGDAMRMHASLVALFNNPQNNLKAFIGGERVSCDDEELCRVLFDPTQCSSRQEYMDMMASLVSRILLQENVLENILSVQTKCTYDIQAVEQMLECLVKGTPMMPDEYNRFLHVLSTYCESATAKDCSIMITMAKDDIQTDTTQQSFKPCNHGCIPLSDTTGASCRYRVTVVDLDRKSLAKITSHASLDRNILESNMIHSDIQ